MPNPKRIQIKNGWYHVINRGVGRRHIFLCDENRDVFLQLLGKTVNKFEFRICGYCLMGNHYHLVINTPKGNISEGMHWLGLMYSKYFNAFRGKDGPSYKSRFRSILICNERYLNNVIRYIHLNPVSANLVRYPRQYEWSSCLDYISERPRHGWLDIGLGEQIPDYKNYLNRGNNKKIVDFYSGKKIMARLE